MGLGVLGLVRRFSSVGEFGVAEHLLLVFPAVEPVSSSPEGLWDSGVTEV